MTEAVSVAELKDFVRNGKPGQWFCYATAVSLMDSMLTRGIQRESYRLATLGVIYLVQRRVQGVGMFDYIAIKASPIPVTRLIPFSDEKLREKKGPIPCQEPV